MTARVVVITGASSGIGRSAARAFSRAGASVVLAARSIESLTATAAECDADGGQTLVVITDVADAAAVDDLFAAAVARFGRVDVVVHAAAAVSYGRFEDVPAEVFDRVMAINVVGTANVARAALRQFRAQSGGRLILLGSLLGKIAVPYMSPYVTSKWAVHGLSRILQVEARQIPGVRVTVVSPASVNTPAYVQAANYSGWEGRPPPPVDPPEKVARAIVRAADRPRRDRGVGVANPLIVAGFRVLPGAFDLLVTPLMRAAALSNRPLTPNPGTVFQPRPGGDAEHGRWGRHWLRAAACGAAAVAAITSAVGRRRQPPPER